MAALDLIEYPIAWSSVKVSADGQRLRFCLMGVSDDTYGQLRTVVQLGGEIVLRLSGRKLRLSLSEIERAHGGEVIVGGAEVER